MQSGSSGAGRTLAEHLKFRVELLVGLVRREVVGRYRNSMLGMAWSLVGPILMLLVYTVAFHDLLGARWPGVDGKTGFAAMVFSGLMMHSILAETLGRAPASILGQPNFVTKLVFPLAVLPLVPVGVACVQATLGLLVLIGAALVGVGPAMHPTAALLPLVMLPYALMMAGFAWALAALGVYVRDIAQVGGLVSTALMFLSPVFFPLSQLPESYAVIVQFNPVTFAVEATRQLMFVGTIPDLNWGLRYVVASVVIASLGLWAFRKMRPGFGDVL